MIFWQIKNVSNEMCGRFLPLANIRWMFRVNAEFNHKNKILLCFLFNGNKRDRETYTTFTSRLKPATKNATFQTYTSDFLCFTRSRCCSGFLSSAHEFICSGHLNYGLPPSTFMSTPWQICAFLLLLFTYMGRINYRNNVYCCVFILHFDIDVFYMNYN